MRKGVFFNNFEHIKAQINSSLYRILLNIGIMQLIILLNILQSSRRHISFPDRFNLLQMVHRTRNIKLPINSVQKMHNLLPFLLNNRVKIWYIAKNNSNIPLIFRNRRVSLINSFSYKFRQKQRQQILHLSCSIISIELRDEILPLYPICYVSI